MKGTKKKRLNIAQARQQNTLEELIQKGLQTWPQAILTFPITLPTHTPHITHVLTHEQKLPTPSRTKFNHE